MQLFVIDWLFQNAEDQLFETNEFCEFLKVNKFNQHIDGFELKIYSSYASKWIRGYYL